jgi:hypothetical protein
MDSDETFELVFPGNQRFSLAAASLQAQPTKETVKTNLDPPA